MDIPILSHPNGACSSTSTIIGNHRQGGSPTARAVGPVGATAQRAAEVRLGCVLAKSRTASCDAFAAHTGQSSPRRGYIRSSRRQASQSPSEASASLLRINSPRSCENAGTLTVLLLCPHISSLFLLGIPVGFPPRRSCRISVGVGSLGNGAAPQYTLLRIKRAGVVKYSTSGLILG